jgi:hypothetical protein
MVRLLVLGFDLRGTEAVFPGNDVPDVYDYRIGCDTLVDIGDKSYYVIYVLRDPRAVMTSRHPSHTVPYTFGFQEWYTNYKACMSLSDQINVCLVRYKDLLLNPVGVQEHVSNKFGLPQKAPFDECAHRVPTHGLRRWKDMDFEMGGARPLDPQKITRWQRPQYRETIRQQLATCPEMVDVLVQLGFEEDDSWIKKYNLL